MSWPGRLVSLPVLAAAAALAFFAARLTMASLYGEYAATMGRGRDASERARAAADLASTLAPWHSDWVALAALSSGASDPHDRQRMQHALRWAPADAAIWRFEARAHARAGDYGASYRKAISRIGSLAPTAPDLHRAIALDGVYGWRHGDAAVREQWLHSARVALRLQPAQFLRVVALSRRELYFCAYAGSKLNVQGWCRHAATARRYCSQRAIPQAHRQQCTRRGFLP